MVKVLGTVGDEIIILRVLVVFREFGKYKKIAEKILKILRTVLGGDKVSQFVNAKSVMYCNFKLIGFVEEMGSTKVFLSIQTHLVSETALYISNPRCGESSKTLSKLISSAL
jgi:hypothetical protein